MFCSWEFTLSNSVNGLFVSILVSVELNRMHYFQSNLRIEIISFIEQGAFSDVFCRMCFIGKPNFFFFAWCYSYCNFKRKELVLLKKKKISVVTVMRHITIFQNPHNIFLLKGVSLVFYKLSSKCNASLKLIRLWPT